MGFRQQKAPSAVLIFDWDDTICPSTFVEKFKVDSFKELPGNGNVRSSGKMCRQVLKGGIKIWRGKKEKSFDIVGACSEGLPVLGCVAFAVVWCPFLSHVSPWSTDLRPLFVYFKTSQ
eukprot:scaffold145_cov173-Amphora_coffeaeformis.AAC.16